MNSCLAVPCIAKPVQPDHTVFCWDPCGLCAGLVRGSLQQWPVGAGTHAKQCSWVKSWSAPVFSAARSKVSSEVILDVLGF